MNESYLSNPPYPEPLPEHRIMVLLVDDQAMVGEAVRRQLSDQAHMDFHYCPEGAAAIRLASEIRPTVILQDLLMPGVDGLELVRKYRQTPETKYIPIIVLSATEDPEIKSQAFSAGANDYVVKLPDKVEMIARISYHSRAYLNQIERDEAYRALRKSQRQLVDGNMVLTQLSQRLQRNNEALQAAERLARMGSWSWEIARDEAVWSAALYEMFLWDTTRPAPRFEDLKMIFTPESVVLLHAAAAACTTLGTSYNLDLEGIRTNGEHFFVNAKGQAARDPTGKITSVFGTIHDITEQRKLGEIAQKSAVLEERARIAGEIHDSLAQSFAAIVLQTEIAEEQWNKADRTGSMNCISKARDLARFGLAEARRSALTLRPSHALLQGLVHALKQLFDRASIKDVLTCETTTKGTPRRLAPLVEHALFRVAQEALNNAGRHAKANRITSLLHFRKKTVTLTIEDNGIGLPVDAENKAEGFGLAAMRERAEKAGGHFSIEAQPGKGTRVTVEIPDPAPAPKAKP